MGSMLAPQTKSHAARPPIDPPARVTFSSSPDDRGEPWFRVLADSVDRLIRSIPEWPLDDLDMLMRLLEQRKAVVEKELEFERMITYSPLPPPIEGLHSIDHLIRPESEALWTYLRLMSSLQSAIAALKPKISLLKDLPPSSEV